MGPSTRQQFGIFAVAILASMAAYAEVPQEAVSPEVEVASVKSASCATDQRAKEFIAALKAKLETSEAAKTGPSHTAGDMKVTASAQDEAK